MSNTMIGKKVNKLMIAEDKLALLFVCDDGEYVVNVDADCCSYTWIEHVELPALGFPFEITSINYLEMPETEKWDEHECELTQFYGCKVTTTKGDMVIDYRNESNGYYGGNIVWPSESVGFYGGVYGQNVSKENWIEIKEDI